MRSTFHSARSACASAAVRVRTTGCARSCRPSARTFRAFAWSALVANSGRTIALVAPSEDRARRWRAELAGWLGDERVLAFPERETMPFEVSAPSGTAVHQRLLTLWRLASAQAPVAVV